MWFITLLGVTHEIIIDRDITEEIIEIGRILEIVIETNRLLRKAVASLESIMIGALFTVGKRRITRLTRGNSKILLISSRVRDVQINQHKSRDTCLSQRM